MPRDGKVELEGRSRKENPGNYDSGCIVNNVSITVQKRLIFYKLAFALSDYFQGLHAVPGADRVKIIHSFHH